MTAPTEENQAAPAKKLAGNSRSDLIDLLRKSGVSLVLKFAGGLAAFVMTLVAGRILGTAGSGVFFLSLAIVTVAASISRVGLDQAVTRFVAEAKARQDWDSINGLYSRALATVFVTSSLLSLLLYSLATPICVSIFDDPSMLPCFRWMSLSIIGFAVTWLHSHFFQGMEAIKRFQLFQNLAITVFFLISLIGLLLLKEDLAKFPKFFAICFFGSSVFTTFIAHFSWRRSHRWFSWHGNANEWNIMLPLLGSFFGSSLVVQLYIWSPQLILGFFRESNEVGIYNAAFRVSSLTALVLLGINSVVFPKFAALHSSGETERLKTLAQSSAKITAFACVPFLMVLLIYPGPILSFFGSDFRRGALALQITSIGQLVNATTGSVGGLLNMTGNHHLVFTCSTISLMIMLATAFAFTPLLGTTGTAIAQAVGLSTNMLLLTVACKRQIGFAPLAGLRAP